MSETTFTPVFQPNTTNPYPRYRDILGLCDITTYTFEQYSLPFPDNRFVRDRSETEKLFGTLIKHLDIDIFISCLGEDLAFQFMRLGPVAKKGDFFIFLPETAELDQKRAASGTLARFAYFYSRLIRDEQALANIANEK